MNPQDVRRSTLLGSGRRLIGRNPGAEPRRPRGGAARRRARSGATASVTGGAPGGLADPAARLGRGRGGPARAAQPRAALHGRRLGVPRRRRARGEDADHRPRRCASSRRRPASTLPERTELVPFSRWITPRRVKVRFDTWFFAAEAPRRRRAAPSTASECVDARWIAPGGCAGAAHARTSWRSSSRRSSTSSCSRRRPRSRRRSPPPARGRSTPILPKVAVRDGATPGPPARRPRLRRGVAPQPGAPNLFEDSETRLSHIRLATAALSPAAAGDRRHADRHRRPATGSRHPGPRPALRRGRRRRAHRARRGDFSRPAPGRRHVDGGGGLDLMIAGTGNDSVDGATDRRRLRRRGRRPRARAGRAADTLFGQDGSDRLFGGAGPDRLYASLGADFVDAGSGDDTLFADGTGITLAGRRRRRRRQAVGRRDHRRGRRRHDRIRTATAGPRLGRPGRGLDRHGRGNDRSRRLDGRRDRVRLRRAAKTRARRRGRPLIGAAEAGTHGRPRSDRTRHGGDGLTVAVTGPTGDLGIAIVNALGGYARE